MVRTLVVSALGRESLSSAHQGRLDALGPADIVSAGGPMTDEEFVALADGYDVVAMTRRPKKYLHRSLLSRLPTLKSLVVHTTGTHWIDVDYLGERHVAVVGLEGYATETVAEHAMASLLMLSRRTHLSVDRARGLVPASVSLRGFELQGRTLGLIGYGRIGRRLHELLGPIGLNVVICDPLVDQSVGLDQLLGCSEIVVLAASQEYGRAPIIDRAALSRGSVRYIVNASCDELVDHRAVIEAVQAGRIEGFVVDEFDTVLAEADAEPGRIVQTMHTGWYADEAMARGKEQWLANIENVVRELNQIATPKPQQGTQAAA